MASPVRSMSRGSAAWHHVRLKALCCAAWLSAAALPAIAGDNAPSSATGPAYPWPAMLRPGIMAGNHGQPTDFMTELFLPAWQNSANLLFVNPNLRLDDDGGEEGNLGLGFRHLLDNNQWLVGLNVFFDTIRSQTDRNHRQWGGGLELLGRWFDLRANFYRPTTSAQSVSSLDQYEFGQTSIVLRRGYEEALRGYDAEAGVLLPYISNYIEARAYLGGYWYEADKTQDINGKRGRLVIRPNWFWELDLEYRDDTLGNAAFVGGFLHIPLSADWYIPWEGPWAGLAEIFTPRPASTTGVSERMAERVVRDRNIRLFTGRARNAEPLTSGPASNVLYVNGDNPLRGDGTLTNPYRRISDLEANPRYTSGAMVYVFSSLTPQANVSLTLKDNMVFWGAGYRHPVYGLGGGSFPVLDGSGGAQVITLGQHNEVMGLTIRNASVGIYGQDIAEVHIHHNIIRDNTAADAGTGIRLENSFSGTDATGRQLSYTIDHNQIINNGLDGIFISSELVTDIPGSPLANGSIRYSLTDNEITGNGGRGVAIITNIHTEGTSSPITAANITSNLTGNRITNNGEEGVSLQNTIWTSAEQSPISSSGIVNRVSGNTMDNNSGTGLSLYSEIYSGARGSGLTDVRLENTITGPGQSFSNNGLDGVYIVANLITEETYSPISGSAVVNTVTDNATNNSAQDGFIIYDDISVLGPESSLNSAIIINVLSSNTANASNGVGLDLSSTLSAVGDISNGHITNILTGNEFNNNSLAGIFEIYSIIDSSGIGTTLNGNRIANILDANTANNNGTLGGIWIGSTIAGSGTNNTVANSSITNSITNNTASGNQDFGLRLDFLVAGEQQAANWADLLLRANTITANSGNGLCLSNTSPVGVFAGDLGGGSLGSTGSNSLFSNGGFDLVNDTGEAVSAKSNWWGADHDPYGAGQIDNVGASTTEVGPWRSSAP